MIGIWVKVCGVTREDDVRACAGAGVDAVGFNFWRGSRRFVPPSRAASLVSLLPGGVEAVGVVVGASPTEVAAWVRESGVEWIQLHGGESAERYRDCGARILPVIRVEDARSFPASLEGAPDRVLLDAHVPGFGGAGASFDWRLVPGATAGWGARIVLAGGLHPGNVAEAVAVVRPFGVDAASGVEVAPGVKDPDRIAAFVAAARGAR